jgi:hypothetical protein
MNPLRLIRCNAIAFGVGLASFAAVASVQLPGTFRYPIPGAIVAAVLYFAAPLFAVSALTLWRRRPAPLYLHLLFSVAWWAFLGYLWVRKPWAYYGALPWETVARMWLPMLPPIVFAGAILWVTSSRIRNDAV